MNNQKITGILILALVLAATLVSLSGPTRFEDEPEAPQRPALDELMPQGERVDSSMILTVLDGGEITEMAMEVFLIGAVAAEMPASFELEALKAQAVAARTNIIYNIVCAPKSNHAEANVCTDFACCMAYSDESQLFAGWGGDYTAYIGKIIEAVTSTDGETLLYGDNPILAVFHSSSAGMTESSGNVWLEDLPYLTTVTSPETSEQVPGFVTELALSLSEFSEIISANLPEAVLADDPSEWITGISHTGSGRVRELTIGGVTIKGVKLRALFNLRSAAVTIHISSSNVVFTTKGFGHGVGMSQYGANAYARGGMSYSDILLHYYSTGSAASAGPQVKILAYTLTEQDPDLAG